MNEQQVWTHLFIRAKRSYFFRSIFLKNENKLKSRMEKVSVPVSFLEAFSILESGIWKCRGFPWLVIDQRSFNNLNIVQCSHMSIVKIPLDTVGVKPPRHTGWHTPTSAKREGEQIEKLRVDTFPHGKIPFSELSGTCLNNPSYQCAYILMDSLVSSNLANLLTQLDPVFIILEFLLEKIGRLAFIIMIVDWAVSGDSLFNIIMPA